MPEFEATATRLNRQAASRKAAPPRIPAFTRACRPKRLLPSLLCRRAATAADAHRTEAFGYKVHYTLTDRRLYSWCD